MKKIIAVLGLLMGLLMVAGCASSIGQKGGASSESTPSEGAPSATQRDYLDKHKEEMSNFVKSYNKDEIHSVEFTWDTAEVSNVSNGTLFGAGHIISLEGTFNDDKDTWFRVAIWLDDDGNPDVSDMYFIRKPKKGEDQLPEKSSD